ncbi:MAG: hypothetical protein WAM85_17965 [Terracidiphilus sp.]
MMGTHAAIFLLAVLLSAAGCAAQNDFLLIGTGNLTKPSTGVFNSGTTIRQSSRGAAGIGVGYERWWGNFGAGVQYTQTPTDSKLSTLTGRVLTAWPIERYEFAVLAEKKFLAARRVSPYVGAGPMGTALWGGSASDKQPGGCSGGDEQIGLAFASGIKLDVSPRLSIRSGVVLDFIKASTFGDQTYRASHTLMVEPQGVGLMWRF